MARKEKMVTRTFEVSTISYMAIKIETKQVEVYSTSIVGTFSTNDEALDAVKAKNDNPKIVPSFVISIEVNEEVRGVPESKFYADSVLLPPRSKNEDEE